MSEQKKTPPKPKNDAETEQESGELSEQALDDVSGGAIREPIVRSSDPQEGGERF